MPQYFSFNPTQPNRTEPIDRPNPCPSLQCRGGDYRETGATRPSNILVGDAKGKCPPLVIRHFSGLLQNAYLSEESKGFYIIKIQFLFSFRGLCPSNPLTRGSASGPRWGLPPTSHRSEEVAATSLGDRGLLISLS